MSLKQNYDWLEFMHGFTCFVTGILKLFIGVLYYCWSTIVLLFNMVKNDKGYSFFIGLSGKHQQKICDYINPVV